MKNIDTEAEPNESNNLSAIKKLNAKITPIIEIIKHIN